MMWGTTAEQIKWPRKCDKNFPLSKIAADNKSEGTHKDPRVTG